VAATALVTVLALVCASGLRISARAWTVLTALKLVPLLALVAAWGAAGFPGPAITAAPAPPPDWLRAALLATFAYQGFEIVPVIAGHVRAPERAVPLATVGSLGVAAVLYFLLQAAALSALPDLASSSAPLAEAAGRLGGPVLGALLGVGTSISALGIALGMVAATPHYLAATARGGTLPFGLDAFDGRAVPRRALFVTWLLVGLLVQAGTRAELFALSSAAVLTQYVVTAASLFALARRRERGLGPRHALLALPAALVGLSLVAGASRREALIAGGAVMVGLALRALAPGKARPPAP
jgi:amino acid transporter